MVQVNISGGSGPSGGGSGGYGGGWKPGSRSQILGEANATLTDNPARQAYMDRMAKAQGAYSRFSANNPDYARAEAQRRAAAGAENRAYASRDRQDAAARAAQNRQTAAETRSYDAQQRADERERRQAERRRQQDERLEAQLRRRQDMEAMRRAQQEWALRRTFSHMQHTAGGNLSPTALRNMGHRADIFDERVEAFRNRWGGAPDYGGNVNNLRGGLGNTRGAFQVQDVLRMGRFGQRAAFEGDYRELVRIEHELKRIEKQANKQYAFDSSPAAQANLERQKRALEGARGGIAAGMAGHGRVYNAVGRGYGNVMNTFKDPVMRTAMDIALATVAAPYTGNRLLSGAIGMAEPYLNWDIASHTLARGSGGKYDAIKMQRYLLNMNKSGMLIPGNGMTALDNEFGLDPSKVVNQALNGYGVPLKHAWSAPALAASVRMASLAGGMQLPEDQLTKGLGGAVSIGAVGNGQQGWNQYFRQLQKTMAVATKEGVNESQMAGAFNTFMQSAASNASPMSFEGLSSFWRSLVGTSNAGRTGALQSSIMQGVQQTTSSLGGDNSGTLVVGSFLNSHREAFSSGQALAKALGVNYKDITSTPQGKRAMDDVIAAAKANNPWATEQYLGALLQNNPEALKRIYNQAPITKNLGPLGDIIFSRSMNLSLSAGQAWQTAQPGAGSAAMGGLIPYSPQDVQQLMDFSAKRANMTKAMQTALVMTESSGNPYALSDTGAVGLTQIEKNGALADYNQAHPGANLTMDEMRKNQKSNLMVGDWYYQKMLKLAHGNAIEAYGLYNWGPGKDNSHVAALENGGWIPAETRQGMARFGSFMSQAGGQQEAISDYQKLGLKSASQLEGARYIDYMGDKVVAAFSKAASAITDLGSAAEFAAKALRGIAVPTKVQGGYIAPNGAWIPHSIVPNDKSNSILK